MQKVTLKQRLFGLALVIPPVAIWESPDFSASLPPWARLGSFEAFLLAVAVFILEFIIVGLIVKRIRRVE
jgi:hypothetical protein